MIFEKEYFEKNSYLFKEEKQNRKYISEMIKWASKVSNKNLLNGKKKKALVAGCGFGFGADILSKLGYKVYGLDISKYTIRYAKQHFSHPNFMVCDVQNGLPFRSDFFDFVLCIEVLEHLYKPKKTLSELYRVCNDSILCTSPNRRVEKPIRTIVRAFDETHINTKTEKEWESLINKNLKPHFLKIESFIDSYLSANSNFLFCRSFKLPYFGLTHRIFFRK